MGIGGFNNDWGNYLWLVVNCIEGKAYWERLKKSVASRTWLLAPMSIPELGRSLWKKMFETPCRYTMQYPNHVFYFSSSGCKFLFLCLDLHRALINYIGVQHCLNNKLKSCHSATASRSQAHEEKRSVSSDVNGCTGRFLTQGPTDCWADYLNTRPPRQSKLLMKVKRSNCLAKRVFWLTSTDQMEKTAQT